MVPWPCCPPPTPPVVIIVIPSCGLIGASKGLVVPVFPVVSPSSFHPPTTPRAVAHEAGGGWCVVGSPSSSSCIHGGHGGGGPPSCPGPEGVSWGQVGVSSMRHRPWWVLSWSRGRVVHPPLPLLLLLLSHRVVSLVRQRGWLCLCSPWSPHHRSTHQPPHEQLLVRLGVGGASFGPRRRHHCRHRHSSALSAHPTSREAQ